MRICNESTWYCLKRNKKKIHYKNWHVWLTINIIYYKCTIFKHLCYFTPHHVVYEHKISRHLCYSNNSTIMYRVLYSYTNNSLSYTSCIMFNLQRILWYCSANNKRIKKFFQRLKANNMKETLNCTISISYCSLFTIILLMSKANNMRSKQY